MTTHAKSHLPKTLDSTKTSKMLVDALESASRRLSSNDAVYQWGHMGQCNVGHVVQSLTGLTSAEIVESVDYQLDEWSEHANDYCPTSGRSVDSLFTTLQQYGLSRSDLIDLEHLSNTDVLKNLPGGFRYLRRNNRHDVSQYMLSFAGLLEGNSL